MQNHTVPGYLDTWIPDWVLVLGKGPMATPGEKTCTGLTEMGRPGDEAPGHLGMVRGVYLGTQVRYLL